MDTQISEFVEKVSFKNPGEYEFIQAVKEVADSISSRIIRSFTDWEKRQMLAV